MAIVVDPGTPNPSLVTTATSSDGKLTVSLDDAHGGFLLMADFSGDPTLPYQVEFTRNGSTTVRSGDPAWASGGVAYAYDHEAPLAVSSSWTATPLYLDGTTGTATTAAALTLSALSGTYDFWVKSIDAPALSVLVTGFGSDTIQVGRTGQLNLTQVPGSSYPVAAWNPRGFADMQITFKTETLAERDALDTCLNSGVLLVQCNPTYGIPDFYCLAGDDQKQAQVFQFDPRWLTMITFTAIARPPTVDTPLVTPWLSCGSLADAIATCAGVPVTYPTCGSMVAL